MATQPLNILTLDGGGVRGLSSLLVLQDLMAQLQIQSKNPDLRPCDIFDLICGTSTGGLTALMLGRLRMSVKDAITCYLSFSETVFGEKLTGSTPSLHAGWWSLAGVSQVWRTFQGNDRKETKGSDSAIYDASKLEKWVKELVAKHEKDGRAPLRDPLDGKDGCCRTFVVAVTQAYVDAPPKLFRSYSTESEMPDTCRIWEAARATTAAVPFFEPVSFGTPPQRFIDGAFSGENNPSRLAFDEACELFPGRPIGCFLSIGTGKPDVVEVSGSDANIAEACRKLVESCEGVDNAVRKDFRKRTQKGEVNPYFRFSVDRGLGNIMLDEWNKMQKLTAITSGYMRYDEQREKAERCVEVLKMKAAASIALQQEESIT